MVKMEEDVLLRAQEDILKRINMITDKPEKTGLKDLLDLLEESVNLLALCLLRCVYDIFKHLKDNELRSTLNMDDTKFLDFLDSIFSAKPQNTKDKEHFVDRHRAALIEQVPLVTPILDDLYQRKLLIREAYDGIRSMATSQEQMREIYRFVESWRIQDKEQLLQSLRRHSAPLIRKLRRAQ